MSEQTRQQKDSEQLLARDESAADFCSDPILSPGGKTGLPCGRCDGCGEWLNGMRLAWDDGSEVLPSHRAKPDLTLPKEASSWLD